MVNDFIQALAYGEKEKALTLISKVREGNISIKTFNALVLEKVRIVLLFKNMSSQTVDNDLKQHVSEDDWKIIETLAKDEKSKVNSGKL